MDEEAAVAMVRAVHAGATGSEDDVSVYEKTEVLYHPGTFGAAGPVKGMSEEEIARWVMREIGPGNIEVNGKRWGLSID